MTATAQLIIRVNWRGKFPPRYMDLRAEIHSAAQDGGWHRIVEYRSPSSLYMTIQHTKKKAVTIRLSDHRGVQRNEGEKLIRLDVLNDNRTTIDNILKFLRKAARCR